MQPVASSDAQVNLQPAPKVSLSVETTAFTENLVPAVDPLFVPLVTSQDKADNIFKDVLSCVRYWFVR